MSIKNILFVFLLILSLPSISQSIDFVYVDLNDCDLNCRDEFKSNFSSFLEQADSVLLYISNDQNPFVSTNVDEIKNNLDMLLRKQFKSPIFIEDLKLVSKYLNEYNFIDLTDIEVNKINFHFYFESNRLVRNFQGASFVNQILLSNNCKLNGSIVKNASVMVYLKKFQVESRYNTGLRYKINELKSFGYE